MVKLFFIFCTLFFLSSCNKCNKLDAGLQQYFLMEEVPNVLRVENLQSTYNLNDTVWFSISIPEVLGDSGDNVTCNISGEETIIYVLTPTITTINGDIILDESQLFYRIGSFGVNNFHLIKNGNIYEMEFGVLLEDLSYEGISLGNNEVIGILSHPSVRTPYCGLPETCEEFKIGFEFITQIENVNDSKISFTVVP